MIELALSWQSIITAGAVVGALVTLITLLVKFVRWVDHQKEQDKAQAELKAKHDTDMLALKTEQAARDRAIQREQTMICYGVLACLKGLKEQGCNGPVTDALNKLEKHLNNAAHDVEEEVLV